jgi:hypothetical protein
MHGSICLTLGLVLVSTFAAIASANDLVTAEWNADVAGTSFGSFGGTGFSQARGQTFEATVDGRVKSIELRLARNSDHSEPIVIELFAVDASDKPVGSALLSGQFPAAEIPVNVITAPSLFSFDDELMLSAGQRYAITFRPLNLDPNGNNYGVNGGVNENATYEAGSALRSADGGATWIVETIIDWGFRVTVDDSTPVEAGSWGVVRSLYR